MKRQPSYGEEIQQAKLRIAVKRELRRAGVEIPEAIARDLEALRALRDHHISRVVPSSEVKQ